MVWYSHLLKNFPQFIVIHTVKGFGTVNKAEIDVFLEFSFLELSHSEYEITQRIKTNHCHVSQLLHLPSAMAHTLSVECASL